MLISKVIAQILPCWTSSVTDEDNGTIGRDRLGTLHIVEGTEDSLHVGACRRSYFNNCRPPMLSEMYTH